MDFLDMRTVLASYFISNAICAAVLGSLWWQNRKRSPELGLWMADFIMQFAALLLITRRGSLPDFISIVISNALVIGGTWLLYIGLERYTRKSSPQWFNGLYLGIFLLVQTYFTYGQPSLPARNINFSFALLVICSQCAWLLLWRVTPERRPGARPAGLVFSVFGLVSLARIFLDHFAPPGNDLFTSSLYETLIVLTYQMLYISLTFGLFLMVNRRLLTTLEKDIDEMKKAEKAIAVSEEKFAKAFQTSPYAITITRAEDGRFIDVNPAFTTITGYQQEEALADSSIGLNLWVDLEDRNKVVAALAAGQVVEQQEFLFRRKNGETLTGLFSAQMIHLSQGQCILSSIDDITDKKRAEQALQEYNIHLEAEVEQRTLELREAQQALVRQERLAVLGQLSGSIGHELRNPLAAISNAVYYLKMVQPDIQGKIQENLDIIEQESHNADKIITDLLDFARIKAAEVEPVCALELVERVLKCFPPPASLQVSLDFPKDLPQLLVNPRQIEQVLINLTVNAYQAMEGWDPSAHTQEGGKLVFRARPAGGMVAIAVQDKGVGISAGNMKRLFEPLYTTKIQGIGLGLVVCKKLTESNGGSIQVESVLGEGTTFTLNLPAYQMPEAQTEVD